MARRGWLAWLPIAAWFLSGCTWTDTHEPSSWMKRFHDGGISPEHALIEVALIEQPIGDEFINYRLWQGTDELIVNLEQRGLLDENGLRLGQLVGAPPNEFHQMLLSRRFCSNPEAMIFPASKVAPIYLGLVRPHATYEVVLDKRRSRVDLDQARFCFDVAAGFVSDGRTKLTFTPKVENGETILPYHAAPDRSAWELRLDKANKKYPELSFEVVLDNNQFLVIGGRLNRAGSLGLAAFTQFDDVGGVQRLLVIRNCRSLSTEEAHQYSADELLRANKVPPLALQASIATVRANSR